MLLPRRPESWIIRLVDDALDEYDSIVPSYVSGVLLKQIQNSNRPHERSAVLAFADARWSNDFVKYQSLADWILFTESVLFRDNPHRSIVLDVGRWSYDACWRILRGHWTVYEALAEELPKITRAINKELCRGSPEGIAIYSGRNS